MRPLRTCRIHTCLVVFDGCSWVGSEPRVTKEGNEITDTVTNKVLSLQSCFNPKYLYEDPTSHGKEMVEIRGICEAR